MYCAEFIPNEVINMIAFIKGYTLLQIKKKLLFLYMLNLLDILFTLSLLSTGLYMETNPLIADKVQNPIAFFTLKSLLPALLLIFIYLRMQDATEKQLKQSNRIINIAIIIYGLVNISHIVWISLIPFFQMNL